jgi:putative endonuclease
MAEYYVYILASSPGAVTNDLIRRLHEHKSGKVEGHTMRYKIDRLVYFESYDHVRNALQREKNIEHSPRVWKTRLIIEKNPGWHDLLEEITCATSS